jgi:hypothetical protein
VKVKPQTQICCPTALYFDLEARAAAANLKQTTNEKTIQHLL